MCVRNPVPLLFSTHVDFCAAASEPHAAAIRVLCSKNRRHLTVLTTTLPLLAATGFHPLVYFPSPYSILIPTIFYSILSLFFHHHPLLASFPLLHPPALSLLHHKCTNYLLLCSALSMTLSLAFLSFHRPRTHRRRKESAPTTTLISMLLAIFRVLVLLM